LIASLITNAKMGQGFTEQQVMGFDGLTAINHDSGLIAVTQPQETFCTMVFAPCVMP